MELNDNLRIREALMQIADSLDAAATTDASVNANGGIAAQLERIAEVLAGGLPGGASKLSNLTDTDISSPSNNDVLTYDSATSKWKNAAGGSGGGLVVTATNENESFVLDKTWKEIHDAIASGQNVSMLLSAHFGQYAMTVVSCLYAEGEQEPYIVTTGDSSFEFTAALQTDYPST